MRANLRLLNYSFFGVEGISVASWPSILNLFSFQSGLRAEEEFMLEILVRYDLQLGYLRYLGAVAKFSAPHQPANDFIWN